VGPAFLSPQANPQRHNKRAAARVLTLEAEAVDFHLPGCAPLPAPEGNRVHLGRGHLTLLARKVGDPFQGAFDSRFAWETGYVACLQQQSRCSVHASVLVCTAALTHKHRTPPCWPQKQTDEDDEEGGGGGAGDAPSDFLDIDYGALGGVVVWFVLIAKLGWFWWKLWQSSILVRGRLHR
jgi:hypothetical protein